MKTTKLICAVAAIAFSIQLPRAAVADCQSACLNQFSDACYNIKDYKWAKDDDGFARVRFRNTSRFKAAFNWAVDELNEPHNGLQPKLVIKPVNSNPDVKIVETNNLCVDGSCGWWGLAHTYRSGSHTTHAKIWLSVDELSENTKKKDRLRRKLTTIHEILHTLGLNHACVNDNHTMWPCGMPDADYVHEPYMSACDVKGLIALYGKASETPANDPTNLLKNASFEHKLENGPFGGWARARPDDAVARRRESAAQQGEYGFHVAAKNEEEFVGAFQMVNADAGERYDASAWARHKSGSKAQCLSMAFLAFEQGSVEVLDLASKKASKASGFHRVELSAKAPAGSQALALFVGNCEVGSSSYHWDRVELEQK